MGLGMPVFQGNFFRLTRKQSMKHAYLLTEDVMRGENWWRTVPRNSIEALDPCTEATLSNDTEVRSFICFYKVALSDK